MAAEKSPAVAALEQEQASRERQGSDLERGLNETFPASDPVSATFTSIPKGTPTVGAGVSSASDAPRVDEVLASAHQRTSTLYASSVPREELQALSNEIREIRDRMAEVGFSTFRVAKAQASDLTEQARGQIRARPVAAVALAAGLGWLWGMSR